MGDFPCETTAGSSVKYSACLGNIFNEPFAFASCKKKRLFSCYGVSLSVKLQELRCTRWINFDWEVAVLKLIPMGFGWYPMILMPWTAKEFSSVFSLVWMRQSNSKSFSISLKHKYIICYSHHELHNSSTSFHSFASCFNHVESLLFPFLPQVLQIFSSLLISLSVPPSPLVLPFYLHFNSHPFSQNFLFTWRQFRRNFGVNSSSICGTEGSDPAPYFHYKLTKKSYVTRMKQNVE